MAMARVMVSVRIVVVVRVVLSLLQWRGLHSGPGADNTLSPARVRVTGGFWFRSEQWT